MSDLMAIPGVSRVTGDQCQYGAEVQFGKNQGLPVKKPTGFLSNGPHILDALRVRCSGTSGECSRGKGGKHQECSGRVASDAARYPPQLCKAIIKGIQQEFIHRGIMRPDEVGLHAVADEEPRGDCLKTSDRGFSGKYRDDISNQLLRDDLVIEARRKEL